MECMRHKQFLFLFKNSVQSLRLHYFSDFSVLSWAVVQLRAWLLLETGSLLGVKVSCDLKALKTPIHHLHFLSYGMGLSTFSVG